ncbi:MAG: putative CRISPR-associated protein [Rhodothermales bacterium]
MPAQRHTLICTVGTSLFSNLGRLSETNEEKPDNWKTIKAAYASEDWGGLCNELERLNPEARLCGAEINTIQEVVSRNKLRLEQLFFLVSDTHAGRCTGALLQRYYERRPDLALRFVEYSIVDDLQDKNPKRFKTHGLRNLVHCIGKCIRRAGGPEYVAIDATGGYKAQIALGVLMGQALDIPVFYKFERFTEIIDFPPLPISLDYDLLGRYADLLIAFERSKVFTSGEIGDIDPKLRTLLTDVEIEGQTLYEINPVGLIYLEGFRYRNPKPPALLPADNKKEPHFPKDHHSPNGFKNFVRKVWLENEWIITAKGFGYFKQKALQEIGFKVWQNEAGYRLIGTYVDRNNFGGRFQLCLTDESHRALVWAADLLNRKYA